MADLIKIRRHDGIVVAVVDDPDRPVNVVGEELLESFAECLRTFEADRRAVGMVIASGKPGSFGTGADIDWLPQLARRPDVEAFLARNHAAMTAMARSGKPIVAALNGPALGGAFELALGATAIVAHPGVRVGLPETGLGLIPGGGGTQLLRRFVSTAEAERMLVGGRVLRAEQALEIGLLAALSTSEDDLIDRATDLARSLAGAAPRPVEGDRTPLPADRAAGHLGEARRGARAALVAGIDGGLEAGLQEERRVFIELLSGPEFRAARHLRSAERAIRSAAKQGSASPPVAALGVVGAGQMGAGIAAVASARGLGVVLRDVDESRLRAAAERRDRLTGGPNGSPGTFTVTTAWDGFDSADAVIEAVFELESLKHEILAGIEQAVTPRALVATNTSALSVTGLAQAAREPHRFLGMHFFSPVERMPLVELVAHPGTSADTLARARALAGVLGKTPIVVTDSPGFYTSRVYARWLVEGVRLVLEGMPVEAVDAAAVEAGFPVGPLRAIDQAGLRLVLQASIGQVARKLFADRLDVEAIEVFLRRMVEDGAGGRAERKGFYAYDADGRRGAPGAFGAPGVPPEPPDGAAERMLFAFLTEAWLCWDDQIIEHPDEGDVGAVLGIGFPRLLGGPFHWADSRGAGVVLDAMRGLDPRAFPPGGQLPELERRGGTFSELPRHRTGL
ncbi:3-hydroxyacyl-CoA dehydrogenase NAD-binding domain-containing protein [Actinomadura rugatobispora]|uniref:3-hydroxyacyl-CoA dehydrogenase NAD-binding domain-containing protein n=1 Tax=Actinomadura rugatobispora TaxID=1994 RepID=A0ABW1A1B9_9ACTN|nr:fatty acid oxidation complex subunit alpha FadJ [Actinomadura rugatobispora]